MRYKPDKRFLNFPCSFVGVACAYEAINGYSFPVVLPEGLKKNGYLTLNNADRFVRKYLPVRKKVYFKRKERFKLKDFLKDNISCCCICVLGHFMFACGSDYWSFFDIDNDDVVCVWYLWSV